MRIAGSARTSRRTCLAGSSALRILAAFMCGLTGDAMRTRGDLDHCPDAVARAIYAAKFLGADDDTIRRELLVRRGSDNRVLLELCWRVLGNAGAHAPRPASTFDVCSCAIWDPGALDGWEESPVVIHRAQ